jgi:hypothetical protein
VDGRRGLGLVRGAVELGHAHAAEPEGGDGEGGGSGTERSGAESGIWCSGHAIQPAPWSALQVKALKPHSGLGLDPFLIDADLAIDRPEVVGDLSQLGEDPIAVLIEQVEARQLVPVALAAQSAYARTVRMASRSSAAG